MWIVVNALRVYRMTVRTQHFGILRRSFGRLCDDPRVAVCSVMLVALGFDPVKAAGCSRHRTRRVRRHGNPVVTLAQVTWLPLDDVATVVGSQTPLHALAYR